MEKRMLLEETDEIKELQSLKGAFSSERLRWLIGQTIPELMDEEQYDEIVDQVIVEEKVRSIIFNKAKELGMEGEIKEFIVYHYGDKTIMGIDRDVLDQVISEFKEKGPSAIRGTELLPGKLWLVV
jgi:hypothetical protein